MRIKRLRIMGGIHAYECYIDLYDQYFYVLFGEKDLSRMQDYLKMEESGPDGARGMVVYNTSRHFQKGILAWFPNRSHEAVASGTLVHEIMHIADYMSQNKGLRHDVENQEVYAHLIGYLFRSLYPLFERE